MTKVISMRGVEIDVAQIIAKYEHAIAVGNANLNARGDQLGPGGKIVKRREDMVQDYYRANPKAVKQVSLRQISPDVFDSPASAVSDPKVAESMTKNDAYQRAKARAAEETQAKMATQRKRKIVDSED